MTDYTISEHYVLPSKGLIYKEAINPNITLRSMTTRDEMKRLTKTDTPYKLLCDIIEDCIVGQKPAISVYDMCLGDYQFLLHKLRVVTYGADYKMTVRCPVCGSIEDTIINLDDLKVLDFDASKLKELCKVTLPMSNKVVEMKLVTPRSLDEIMIREKEIKRKSGKDSQEASSVSFLLTIMSLIKTVDGVVLNPAELETFVKNLPMKDTNILIRTSEKLNREVGLDTLITVKCNRCGHEILSSFRDTSEFFGPTID